MNRRIVFIGFMGSGKSYMGEVIARHYDLLFTDIDNLIEKSSGLSINEIFLHGGERHFRKMERKAINDLHKEKVIATGAGIVDSALNRGWLKEAGNFVVWLNIPWEVLWERIKDSPRPKVRSLNESDLYELWRKRCLHYQECADLVYEKEDPDELIKLIDDNIQKK